MGELVGLIISNQFTRLMNGDPHFYLSDDDLWDEDLMLHVMDLSEVTLQQIIKRNTVIDHDSTVSAFVDSVVTTKTGFPLTTQRSYNGTDRADELGAAETPLLRMSSADMTYTDVAPAFKETMMVGTNARTISNTIFDQTDANGDHVDKFNQNSMLDMVS